MTIALAWLEAITIFVPSKRQFWLHFSKSNYSSPIYDFGTGIFSPVRVASFTIISPPNIMQSQFIY